MTLAILQTGRPPPALEVVHGDYPQMFARLLGVPTVVFDAPAGELPAPEEHRAVLITGSPVGVYDDLPWIPPLLEWIRGVRGRTRLVGVCFGHQALAQALGGRVEKSARGWGVGLHAYEVAGDEPWMRPAARRLAIPASHQDQVVEPPPGARVIASSPFTPYAGLALGEDVVGFQCHPEFDPAFATALVEARRGGALADAVADAAVASLQQPDDRGTLGAWIANFIA